ncbi:MAG: RagB/SusD family nutrient uptake outer membrane protein [Tannerella sp.]|nr:RagB/SusD family nutrient uptake outer membrane protein [Tannerella sp.]
MTLVTLFLTGCEDVMNKQNLSSLTADKTWEDPVLVKGFLDNVMNSLPGVGGTNHWTEESFIYDRVAIPYDVITSSIRGQTLFGVGDCWYYGEIRNINKFLENVDLCTSLPAATRNDYVAQILVLRAWLYFNMVRVYGGIPLVLNEQRADEDLYVKRNKTSECITQIIKDIDDAIAYGDDFPIKRDKNEAGRINRAGALALKGRILLFYASPQFSHETPAGTKSANQRWQEAYDANKAAQQQLTAAGYGLFRPNPANGQEALQNLRDMFSDKYEYPENPEMIWVKPHQYPASVSSVDAIQGMTLEMANAFLKADGSPYTELVIENNALPRPSAGTSEVAFWIGREPRFYLCVAYNGCNWPRYRSHSENTGDLDEDGKMRHYWKFIGGQSPYGSVQYVQDGTLDTRKFCDDNINYDSPEGNRSGVDEPVIRYAEVLLNLAECAAKTSKEQEAIDILKQIRRRAGIPQGDNNYGLGNPNGDALILAIIKERQLELYAEGFRYNDLRRWRLYTDEINGYKVNGLYRHDLTAKPKRDLTDAELASIDVENDPQSYFELFENQFHALDGTPFQVTERQNFLRIPFEEHIKKNPNLEQTILWDNGTFNPYE